MPSPSTLKWLHRVGYACTALVAIELLGVTALMAWGWMHNRQRVAAEMYDTSTQERQLTSNRFGRDPALDLFQHLPSRATLDGNGLRFAGMAQLGWVWYALSAGGAGDPVPVSLVVNHRAREGKPEHFEFVKFTVPRDAFARMMASFDGLTDGYAGYADNCMDGVGISFERIRGNHITSGSGNAGCNSHYRNVSAAVLPIVLRYAGLANPPLDYHWYPARPLETAQ